MFNIMTSSINKCEVLIEDPIEFSNGNIWYNESEQVYKCVVDNQIQILLNTTDIEKTITEFITSKTYTIDIRDVNHIHIKHNNNTKSFNYRLYDNISMSTILCSVNIIDENEFEIHLVDNITGDIYISFN